ncbi:MAG TPA: hypothetical protein VMH33_01910 [Solirubrobacterales bacterium]|nr:hypothetical protein [Solirubrobacterales bacterium]
MELADLEDAVLAACRIEAEWPARIIAAVYAGIDFAIANPEIATGFGSVLEGAAERAARYERLIGRFAGFLQTQAPTEERLPGSTDTALIGGIVGLVGDHIRLGRTDRLEELRPDLVLLILLPYLGFSEAKIWANRDGKSN